MENDEIQLRVAYYLRVSTEDQVEKFGLGAQKAAIESLIMSKGKLADGRYRLIFAGNAYEYIDEGVSGTLDLDERPAFARLKEDILNSPEGKKPFDIVAVFKIDRFARKMRILVDVMSFFEAHKIEFISSSESIDTFSAFGRAMFNFLGIVGELELENILDRTQKGREQANLEGVFMGAHAPYGYVKDKSNHLMIIEEEAVIVRKIFTLFTINKLNPQQIATLLTNDEILSPDSSAIHHSKRKGGSKMTNDIHFWRPEKIRDILSDEIYKGVLYYNKSKKGKNLPKSEWKVSPSKHEAIILDNIFELAQHILSDYANRRQLTKKKEDENIYLLSSLLKCEGCRNLNHNPSKTMTWTGAKKKISSSPIKYSYYYQCNRKNVKKFSTVCPVIPIPADALESYVVNFLKNLLESPQATFEYQKRLSSNKLAIKQWTEDRKHFEMLLNKLPARRKNILAQHEEGFLDTPTLKIKLNELIGKENEYKEKINEFDSQLSQEMISKGYEVSFIEYNKKYGAKISSIFKSYRNDPEAKKEIYDLIHGLVDQITIHSRTVNSSDVIAGRKKIDQLIPHKIDIFLKLPQYLLRQMYVNQFGVRTDKL